MVNKSQSFEQLIKNSKLVPYVLDRIQPVKIKNPTSYLSAHRWNMEMKNNTADLYKIFIEHPDL